MKKLVMLMAMVIVTTLAMAQVTPVKFKETKHEFGNVPQGVPAKTVFTFTNTSKAPVIIETAAASCGCTTPTYPKAPILPGKSAGIEVAYNAAAVGHFSKSVTVKLANVEQPIVLFIDGEVVDKK